MSNVIDFRSFSLPEETIGIPGTGVVFRVRALSFEDIVAIFVRHKVIMADLYLRFLGDEADKKKAVKAALGTFIKEAPEVAAAIISVASGCGMDEQAIQNIQRLAFPTQSEALEKIAMLTFGRQEDGAVKKFLGTVTSALAVFNETLSEVSQALPAGSVQSEGT
ncbi:tail protein [Achromobacter phage phiAxp-2]|uniref:Tail protein n=1 Tax=Achromobacter phage phiAxp-2 TaxID=1664246 RepID=A0A0K2FH93_9CAUD|nr:tail protein [Achromobacter phage phiAxp-2]ALA45446.1 tail protein [Achromobacter phage phiAxp-2]